MRNAFIAFLTFSFCLLLAPACNKSPDPNTDKAGTAAELPTNVKDKVKQGGKKPSLE
jgi:hypothetical protein